MKKSEPKVKAMHRTYFLDMADDAIPEAAAKHHQEALTKLAKAISKELRHKFPAKDMKVLAKYDCLYDGDYLVLSLGDGCSCRTVRVDIKEGGAVMPDRPRGESRLNVPANSDLEALALTWEEAKADLEKATDALRTALTSLVWQIVGPGQPLASLSALAKAWPAENVKSAVDRFIAELPPETPVPSADLVETVAEFFPQKVA